jgi:hypothetical protein
LPKAKEQIVVFSSNFQWLSSAGQYWKRSGHGRPGDDLACFRRRAASTKPRAASLLQIVTDREKRASQNGNWGGLQLIAGIQAFSGNLFLPCPNSGKLRAGCSGWGVLVLSAEFPDKFPVAGAVWRQVPLPGKPGCARIQRLFPEFLLPAAVVSDTIIAGTEIAPPFCGTPKQKNDHAKNPRFQS